jgi:hypothetical protein
MSLVSSCKVKLRAALQIAIVALFFYAGTAWPKDYKFICQSHKSLLGELYLGGYAYLSVSTTEQNIVLQTFVNVNTGAWVIIAISEKDACVLMRGETMQFVAGDLI